MSTSNPVTNFGAFRLPIASSPFMCLSELDVNFCLSSKTAMDLQLPPPLEQLMTFAHPVLMWIVLALAVYTLKLGLQVRQLRSAKGAEKKQLIQAKPSQKHFLMGSLYLVLVVGGTIGGMAVTYINNGKLFVGPHLIAGLGMMALVAVAAGMAPLMQQGKDWARNLHIASNVAMLGIFGWQAVTGLQIVQKILFS